MILEKLESYIQKNKIKLLFYTINKDLSIKPETIKYIEESKVLNLRTLVSERIFEIYLKGNKNKNKNKWMEL